MTNHVAQQAFLNRNIEGLENRRRQVEHLQKTVYAGKDLPQHLKDNLAEINGYIRQLQAGGKRKHKKTKKAKKSRKHRTRKH